MALTECSKQEHIKLSLPFLRPASALLNSRLAAVTLLALAWTGFAFCAQGQLSPGASPQPSSRDFHSKCGDWGDDPSKTVAECVVRVLLSHWYHVPSNQSEAEHWANYHRFEFESRHKPISYKDLFSIDQDGYTLKLRHVIIDSAQGPPSYIWERTRKIFFHFHFDEGEQVHVAFADVTGVKTSGGTQWGGSDIHLLSATGELDTIYVSRGERRDAILALRALCPNAKFAGKYTK